MTDTPYDEAYFKSHCGLPYTREEPHWTEFFGTVARNIDERLSPKTVFDAGCAIGLLVEALRNRGVIAFGRDISKYAISQVPAGLTSFCEHGSITDPIEGNYDLVTCIEVLEHMPAIEAKSAIANLCSAAPYILFSSSPTDFAEETHINVQPPLYWMELFAEHGFAPRSDFDGMFLAPWSILFERRGEKPTTNELRANARLIWTRIEKSNQAQELHQQLDATIDNFSGQVQNLTIQKNALQNRLTQARRKPFSLVKDKVQFKTLRALSKLSPPFNEKTTARFARSAKKRDPRRQDFSADGNVFSADLTYAELIAFWDQIRASQLQKLERIQEYVADGPLISLVVPVFNPEISLLEEMIESVRSQTYPKWELCLADDCSREEVRAFLTNISERDPRIKVELRAENGHISRATNSAIQLANGDFIAFVDHDDRLHSDALLFVAKEIKDFPSIKIIYTDEDKIRPGGERFDPHFKPDWNRDYFYGVNYLSHLSVCCADLIRSVGGVREGFEGAQDYDLLLRCIEKIDDCNIRHVPKVLYSWRASHGSTAESNKAKPYATKAGVRALSEHLKRQYGKNIPVTEGPSPFTYRVNWPLEREALVSIIIPTRDKLEVTQRAVESIISRTEYPQFEIIIIDNGSTEQPTLNWLAEIQKCDSRIQVLRDDRPFNYSSLNNLAVQRSRGEFVALLNNDVEVINSDWLNEMVSLAARPWCGCVGAKLYYPDGSIQHSGVVIGIGGVAGHAHLRFPGNHFGYFSRLQLRLNYSAVTAACLVVRRDVYDHVHGLNETELPIAFNDVDFCLKVQCAGFENVWTPWAELIHHESISRGPENTPLKRKRFESECKYMINKWNIEKTPDRHYNENLTLDRHDFSFGAPKWL